MPDTKTDDQTISLTIGSGHTKMDGYQFTSSVIGAVAWPIAAVIIALAFRTQITGLLKRIKEASWGETKVSFSDQLDKVEAGARPLELTPDAPGLPQAQAPVPLGDRFQTLLAISPNLAILDSWADLERSLRNLAQQHNLTENIETMRPDQLALGLKSKGHLTVAAMKTVSEMRALRNRAAHSEDITAADALRFGELAQRMKHFFEA